jgi:glycosyltransferase involved in cell wall biosynthesis
MEVRGLVAGSEKVARESNGLVNVFGPAAESLPKRLWHARGVINEELRTHPPDVVASHFALYTIPAIKAVSRFPFVVHFHGPWADESRQENAKEWVVGLKTRIEKTVYRRASQHIVLSEAFRDVLHQQYDVPLETIKIVPGCVDVARFNISGSKRDARERLAVPLDRPIVFAVRRLVNRMGLEDLVDAVKDIKKSIPEILLVIAGKGKLLEPLQKRINESGLADHVRLAGYVPDEDLPVWYRAADLTVVPTVSLEGFGLITIESLSAGTPVLVTPVGGLPDTVKALSLNLILPRTGAAAIADGISQILLGTLPVPTAEQCLHYARTTFDLPVVAAQTAAVYRQASL